MLEIKNITKVYKTENFIQNALEDVNISFRKNEFVSILGPSGSGKTTLLNIIGGLDHYDSGDLIINGISTKKYKDRDWDTYRNHKVGFVFQSYNLIAHQNVLSNVELALALSGVSKQERRKRAKKALAEVGLLDHINKKPSQLSGGQMQRVAIARALVNNPEILLADEPTGALDSKTSETIMQILKEVAKNRLVIMVTHNPELAKSYSNRIIKLKDGQITHDSNPYKEEEGIINNSKTKKTSMSFITALSLSLNNLLTKKGRTILTAFAGSIGIIGIALILSLSSGVNTYIDNIQKETMLSYPISIEAESVDFSSIFKAGMQNSEEKEINHKKNAIYSNNSSVEMVSSVADSITKNNLTDFKKYLDKESNPINKYVGENGIVYSYNTKFKVFSYDGDKRLINSDGSTFENDYVSSVDNMYAGYTNTEENSIFVELMSGKDGKISDAVYGEYEKVYGSWPEKYNEIVLVLDKNNEVSLSSLYNLGLLPSKEYKKILKDLNNEKKVKVDLKKISYEDITKKTYKLLTASDLYLKNKNGYYSSIEEQEGKIEELLKSKALELQFVGVVKQKDDSKTPTINGSVGYTKSLTDWIIKHTNESDIVKAQENNKSISVFNGLKYKISNDKEKALEAKKYVKTLEVSEKAKLASSMIKNIYGKKDTSQTMYMSEIDLASMLDMFMENPDQKTLISIYDTYISVGSYDETLETLGKVETNTPSKIEIYTDNFENKDKIKEEIKKYNKTVKKENKISYTDYVGLLMSSVTTIVNTISYVLIAFVSISLVVSSIMIAIITYISVLERTKEIGVLRAIGASKKDVTRVFKAETFIEGLIAGILGITITYLLNIPINKIIGKLTDADVTSSLPMSGAIILVLISIILTMIAGLIPSRMASKKDPVESLRSE